MQLPAWPPADLLEQVEGVQQGLRRRRRLGMAGWIGLLLSTAQILIIIVSSEWWQGVRSIQWEALWTQWPFLAGAGLFILSLLLISWSRFWLQESRQPFRYTLSVDGFPAVENSATEEKKMAWLQPDLERRLNERIKRLSLLDEAIVRQESEEGGASHKHDSHIHVSGRYVIRRNPKGRWNIEVMPRVRIGPYGQAETLAHPERFYLDYETERPAGDKEKGTADSPPPLTVRQYERIVERVYSSVSTEIYKQIRQDVQRKIDLLPARRFRAAAYFHEAEDYARSNTLDAYEEARKLYYEAMRLYDPITYGRIIHSRSRALARRAANGLRRFQRWLRERLVSLWPGLAQNEVMAARAEIGYANMLIYHRILATLSGHEPNSFFETPSVAHSAVRRLEHVPDDLAAKKTYLFDAYVTLALALYHMGSNRAAEPYLRRAQQLDPARAERDPQYLLASGNLENRPHSRIPYYRRAVELDPKFEIPRFLLALAMESIWRSQPNLERSGARLVVDEYERVLLLNPGNIGAWANIGYVLWLLNEDVPGGLSAGDAFEYGRDYKEIQPETVVAELDYGIARLKAEQGELEAAYEYYTNAVSAILARRISADDYYFGSMSDTVLQRFIVYRDAVLEQTAGDAPFARRVRSFMWNDYGEACYNYYWRTRFQGWLDNAADAFEKAIALDPDFVLPRYNLARVHQARWGEQAQAKECLEEVLHREPRWINAVLDMADITVQTASKLRQQIKEKGKEKEQIEQQLEAKRKELRDRKRMSGEEVWQRPDEVHFRRRDGDAESVALALAEGNGDSLAGERLLQYLKRIAPVTDREATPPSTLSSMLRPAARSEDDALHALQQEIKRQETELEKLSQEIQRARQDSEKAEEEATQLVRRFLPHRSFRDLGFSAEQINQLLDADVNWEKDLNEAHGQALLRYAQMLVTLNSEKADVQTIEAVYNLNLHIYEKFYPDAFALLNNLNDMAPWLEKLEKQDGAPSFLQRRRHTLARELVREPQETSDAWSQRVRSTVRRRARRLLQEIYEADPAHCNILNWLTAKAFGQSPFTEQIKQESPGEDPLRVRLQWLTHKQNLFEEATSTKNAPSFGLPWLINELASLQKEFQELADEADSGAKKKDPIQHEAKDRAKGCRQSALDACKRAVATCEDVHVLLEVGRHYSRFEQREEAISLLEGLLEEKVGMSDEVRTEVLEEIVLLLWDAGRHDEACHHLNETGHQLATAAEDAWHINFVQQLLSRVDDASRFNELESWLHEEYRRHCRQENAATAANTANESHAALMLLVRERYRPALAAPALAGYRGRKNIAPPLPVTPVALEAGAHLFPEEEGWSDNHPLFTNYIPQMRERIREQMGVDVPGVRLRPNDGEWMKDRYLIQLDEIPTADGWLDPDRRFYPDATAVASHVTLVLNPRTGRNTGAWLTPHESPAMALAGQGWDYFEYMIYHLEAVLKENVSTFFGVQALSNLLDQWADGENSAEAETRRSLRARALPDAAARQRLLQVCHHLLEEGVPITDLHTILTAFVQSEDDSSPLSVGERCRQALRPALPGNEGHRRLIGWSEPFEEEILRNVHGEALTLLPETAQALLAAVRERVGENVHQDLALIVRDRRARPFVRRLTALEFPQMAVLAEDEISGSYVRFLEPVIYTTAEAE
ncbi:MAG: FHIPEP family type III secretion protein [Candidatus Promineifilaceae bacterium]|nr:FHIPEP family type III secretion protein [Candidatus Promineifilaceae bacterium]